MIPVALDRALARLGVTEADREAAAAHVRSALGQAAADHAAFAARSTKAGDHRRLGRVGGIASKASAGDAAALDRLRGEIGDGTEIDDAVAAGVGGTVAGFTDAASSFAHADERHARWWASRVAEACSMATAPAPRRRREAKFFAVLALAFVYVDIAGEAPSFTTAKDTDDRDDGGARMGRFAELVNAADLAFGIPGGDAGFDATIPDVIRAGRAEIALHLATPGRPWPAPFGTPLFACETSDEQTGDEA